MRLNNFTYFYPEKPFLISIEQELFDSCSLDEEWVAEKKYNGIRLQLHMFNGKIEFWGRHGQKLSYSPNEEILEELKSLNLKGYWLFDGELRNNKVKNINNKIMIYDIFIKENEFFLSKKFKERRKEIENLFSVNKEPIGIPFQFKNNFMDTFKKVIVDDEIEGLVLKNLNGKLNLSRKSNIKSTWMYKVRKKSKNYEF